MSHTVPSEPAVVLRSNYVHVRAMLLVAVAAVVGLTIAVVLLASTSTSNTAGTSASRANSAATSVSAAALHANALASAEIGAKLDHSGRNLPISSGSAVPGAGARVSSPQQFRADYPGHH